MEPENHEMPALICPNCKIQIINSYNFKNECESNNLKLLELHQQISSDDEEPDYSIEDPLDIFNGEEIDLKLIEPEEKKPIEEHKSGEVSDIHKCPECDKEFTKKKYLKNHMKTHSEERPYSCNLCFTRFKSSWSVKQHMKSIHEDFREVCTICGKSVIQLRQHERLVHANDRPHKCHLCSSAFALATVLKQHIRVKHMGLRQYKLCSVCGLKCQSYKAIEIHMRSHTGEMPFQCNKCDKKFKTKSNLTVHGMTHSAERPHSCNYCNKAFKTTTTLKKHIRIHTGECPYTCHICTRSFNQSNTLKTHMKIHKS